MIILWYHEHRNKLKEFPMKFYKILLIVAMLSISLFSSEDIPTQEEVAKLYVATFNRAPDSAGLEYWTNSSGLKLSEIAQSFFDQSETQILYPEGTENRDFVESVYANLFNRLPDDEGWSYWIEQLDNNIFSKNRFIEAVINGAKDEDAQILSNKTEVGISFASRGLNEVSQAQSIMANITDDYLSVSTALSYLESLGAVALDPDNCTQIALTDITTDTTWSDSCYTITKDIRVYDEALLTINAGTTLFFKEGIALRIDSALKAVGTATDKILFTGTQSTEGYWDGLYITHANDNRNEIAYSSIEYGGGGYYDASLYIDGDSRVNIHDTTIKYSKTYGFNIAKDVTLTNFKNITSTLNEKAGTLYANNLSKIDSSSQLTGNTNDYLFVDGEDIITDQTWTPLTVPVYFFESDIRVYDGALLTIEPNTTFVCADGFQLRVDSAIKSIGSSLEPIIFKGKQTSSGYWDGIHIYHTTDERNEIAYTTVSDAGGGYEAGAINVTGIAKATIHNTTINNSSTYGIYIGTDATVTYSDNIFLDNMDVDVFIQP